jgi:small-conductance mechanosensitive channel
MRDAIIKVRGEYTTRSIALHALYAALTTLALIIILALFRRIFPALYALIERERGTRLHTIKVQSLELVSEDRLVQLSLNLARILRFTLTALLLYFYIPLVFSFFPWTRSYGTALLSYVFSPIVAGWTAFVDYLPSLLVVFVIIFFAYVAFRLARVLFRELERGSITWPGFYPEWAMPTLKIVQLLILAFAVVVAFPYLPDSNSPAFKGVSIFLGVLFSLGSSSAVSNVIAGVLLTYTRAFHIGDRVQIADTVGDVLEKSLLATQIHNIKNVIVTIPNALVLSSQVINYSQSSQSQPLILHVTVSIGYDAPWR